MEINSHSWRHMAIHMDGIWTSIWMPYGRPYRCHMDVHMDGIWTSIWMPYGCPYGLHDSSVSSMKPIHMDAIWTSIWMAYIHPYGWSKQGDCVTISVPSVKGANLSVTLEVSAIFIQIMPYAVTQGIFSTF